ncbi:MAG TPA: tRNA (N(6)-L-threonylcarbamoyladenosine(37)-C(2))-methylthiotransferase [Candidatus Altiarchaeales archaeon]|nr:tRNA (N(6)-L-threonylcarbamoyladenosine(37)-C(2))-methylthiotransferase [Candidatus Altiarchaeales archaeon]
MLVKVETYGCSLNQADSEVIAGILAEAGHEIVDEKPDLIVVNTCTVKTPTERKIKKRLRRLAGEHALVLVAGCLPAAQKEVVEEFPKFSFIGVNSLDAREAVKEIEDGKRYVNISADQCKLGAPRIIRNNTVGIIPISQGCLGSCTYCITRIARGRLKSYSIECVVGETKKLLDLGCRELWLTSQDNGCWGHDFGKKLPQLIDEVCAVEGDFMLRVGMMNPQHALNMIDGLCKSFQNPKVYKFMHIPVQSGSNKILQDMNRGYTAEEFEKLASIIYKRLDATISTDVILGYPTETEEDFQETVGLIERVRPDVLNISRFWPRPNTIAEKEEGFVSRITKDRSRIMNQVHRKIRLENNRKWIGWRGEVLVSERGKEDSWVGRNIRYKPVIINSSENILGGRMNVEVVGATQYDLRAKIV